MPTETDLIILDGGTLCYTDENGDVEAEKHEGFFYRDVRHLSRWQLRVDGEEIRPLTSRRVDYYSARVVGTPKSESGAKAGVSVRRDRFVSEGLHEDVVVENLTEEPRKLTVEVVYGSDFADLMEAQDDDHGGGRTWGETSARAVTLWEDREGYRRGTALTFNRSGR